ncbi:MAG: hypothetical protein Q9163_002331 [Psora crenata]
MLSRFLPSGRGETSIYETLRQHDNSDESDPEDKVGMGIDEENLGDDFRDYELGDDAPAAESGIGPSNKQKLRQVTSIKHARSSNAGKRKETDDVDNDVPQSLLIEGVPHMATDRQMPEDVSMPPPVPGPSSRTARAKWQAAQRQQRLHDIPTPLRLQPRILSSRVRPLSFTNPKEKATWMWANVDNLDRFLNEVYDYYIGHGIWSILLNRVVKLLTLAFVVAFTTFLTCCVDYKLIPQSKTMDQILVQKCTKNMSGSASVLLWLFAFFWIFKVFDYCRDFRRLWSIYNFYRFLLEIPDSDMQTVSWQEVVKKMMSLRDLNPATAAGMNEQHRRFMGTQSKQRMDAHDIANRLMRRDNYLIALINKDILDFTLPLPFLRNRQLFSRTLEWNLQYCILDFVFNEQGQVRSLFLRDTHRGGLSAGFRSRFLFAGFISLVCAPFAVIYYMLFYFFRYFTEYQRNPSRIGSRQYTPYAEWKFREFNELQHLFERRLNMSYPFASRYVDQFPKDKTIQLSGLVAFIAGALASVLALASLIDPESFLAFEVTRERTVLFYLGVFGSIWAVARGNMPEENLVFDPEYALSNVTEYTHYLPSHWKGRLHTNEVRTEFAKLYQMKVYIFLEEILSIILAPLVLWLSLPNCCDRLVDFFREFTVHVDGMGYVCSFAVFDFQKGGSKTGQLDEAAAYDLRAEYYSTKDGKMMASYYGFKDAYGPSPRPGAPHLYAANKQGFHAPPSFPGLMSPTDVQIPDFGRGPRSQRAPQRSVVAGARTTNQPAYRRSPKFAQVNSQSSPVASVLLDPHHQPTSASSRRVKKPNIQPPLGTRRTLDHPIEDNEVSSGENPGHSAEDVSDGAPDETNLGESWKTTQAGLRDEEADEDMKEDRNPGVLGLVYQFSKAQTGGRPGVNI